MYKTYQAYSDLAFNVKVEGGGLRRVVFDGQSHGTSIYSTRGPKEQKAIEGHYWFNDKFFISEVVDEKKAAAEAKKRQEAAKKKAEDEMKHYKVVDLADAKDWLADNYGVSRSKMKTKEDILTVAQNNGVVLDGLE